jgi:hypothetical protein
LILFLASMGRPKAQDNTRVHHNTSTPAVFSGKLE